MLDQPTPTRREQADALLREFLDGWEVELGVHYADIGITSADSGIVSEVDVPAISWEIVREVLSIPASAMNDHVA